jgi:dihydrolipoamide dehydrogenase
VAEEIKKALKKKAVTVLEKTKVVSVEKLDKGYLLNTAGEEETTIEAEKLLVAVGRRAVLSDDIKNLGVEIGRGVVTDGHMRTSVPGVYAIGDIRAGIMLAHVASYEGIVAAHNIAGEDLEMDYSAVPSIIFSSPEVASTGLRESDLKGRSDVVVSRFPLSANGRARTILESSGFAKILAEHETGKVLGMSIVSPSATDLIMEAVIAVKNGLTVEQLENSIHPHPTLSETVLGALEGVEGKSIHI